MQKVLHFSARGAGPATATATAPADTSADSAATDTATTDIPVGQTTAVVQGTTAGQTSAPGATTAATSQVLLSQDPLFYLGRGPWALDPWDFDLLPTNPFPGRPDGDNLLHRCHVSRRIQLPRVVDMRLGWLLDHHRLPSQLPLCLTDLLRS